MVELPDRINMAREYADSVSTQAPSFWSYAEAVISAWRNGFGSPALSPYTGTQASANLAAILRGELSWPVED